MKYILWSAEFNGPAFMSLEGDTPVEALDDAGINRVSDRIIEKEPGVWDLGDDTLFQIPLAQEVLGAALAKYIIRVCEDAEVQITTQ